MRYVECIGVWYSRQRACRSATDRKIFDFRLARGIIAKTEYPGVAQLVGRDIWDVEVGCSSHLTRTSKKLETERFRAFLFCFFSIALGKHVATVPFQNFGFKKVSASYCSTAGRKDIQIKYLSGRTTISIHIVNKTERGVELGCWGRL